MIKLSFEEYANILDQWPNAITETHANNDIHTGLHPRLGNIVVIAAAGADGAVMIPHHLASANVRH
jgi:hypothetical protein